MFSFLNKSISIDLDLDRTMTKDISEKQIEKIRVILSDIKGATVQDALMFAEIASNMEAGINGDRFKEIVCDNKLKLEFTGGRTNEEIYKKIVSGATELEPKEDREANIHIEIYYSRWSRTIGYTYPNTVWQWFNRKYLSVTKKGKISMANNMMHEYCHKCGFGHQSRGYTRMNVPYFYGDTLEKVLLEE